MKRASRFLTASLVPFGIASIMSGHAFAQSLDSFAILAGSTITNTGPSVISGNVGVSPGSAITGFPPGIVNGGIFAADAVASGAQSDLTIAYNALAARAPTANLTGQDLGGKTLTPGIYGFDTSSQLTGALTLDGGGDPNAVFIFKIGSTLTTASASVVQLINGAQGRNVFFQVGSSATLGSTSMFAGKIFALTSITLGTGAEINCGSALAQNGAVTLDSNIVSVCALAAATYDSLLGANASSNQRAVGSALDTYVAGGGVLPLSLQVLLGILSPAELAAAFAQLSGEAATGVAPTGIRTMNSFTSLLMDAAVEDSDQGGSAPNVYDIPGSGTVTARAYAPDQGLFASRSPFGAVQGRRERSAMPAQTWRMWGAGYGGSSDSRGDSAVGSHARSARGLGFAAGADFSLTPDTRVGFAVGGGGTRFTLDDGLGGGRSDMFQAGLYGRTNLGRAYVASVIAYAWHDASANRRAMLGAGEQLTARFNANNVAGQVEAGYRLGWIVPFASVGVQAFVTPSYREQSTAGASLFALAYESRTAVAARTQLGFRIDHVVAVGQDVTLRLRAKAAWAHDFSHVSRVDASFQALPGSNFSIVGAPRARDALLLSGGPEMRFKSGLTATASFETEQARSSQAYGARGQLRWTW
jgi:uncharacterized protein with beta-barrel porin domain